MKKDYDAIIIGVGIKGMENGFNDLDLKTAR